MDREDTDKRGRPPAKPDATDPGDGGAPAGGGPGAGATESGPGGTLGMGGSRSGRRTAGPDVRTGTNDSGAGGAGGA